MQGQVKFDYELRDGLPWQGFGVAIKHAPANKDYRLMVDFGNGGIDFGIFSTNSLGSAGLEFDSTSALGRKQIADFLPPGQDVRNIRCVQILLGDKPVLEARF